MGLAAYLLWTVFLHCASGYVIVINKVVTNYGFVVFFWLGVFRGHARQIGVGKVGVARRGRETRIWLCLLLNNPFVKHARAAALDGLDWLDKRLALERVLVGGGVRLVVCGHFKSFRGS